MDPAVAYARLARTPAAIEALLPRLSGAKGIHLTLDPGGASVGPPAEVKRYRGLWRTAGVQAEADVTLFPFSAWGTEIHVRVFAPAGLWGRVFWSPTRRGKLAEAFAAAIADAAGIAQTKRPEDARAQTPPRNTAA
jgi:hypothetical protein